MHFVQTLTPDAAFHVPAVQSMQVFTDVAAGDVLYLPARQFVQLLIPVDALYVPAMQSVQVSTDIAPGTVLYLPVLQFVQVSTDVALRNALYVPAMHLVQVLAPDALYVPARHPQQWLGNDAPANEPKVPALQFIQVLIPVDSMYVPAMQSVQPPAPSALYVPTPQGMQFGCDCPVFGVYLPAAQGVHVLIFISVLYVPGEHRLHGFPDPLGPYSPGRHMSHLASGSKNTRIVIYIIGCIPCSLVYTHPNSTDLYMYNYMYVILIRCK
jgi:hypothetical protein